MSPIPRSTRREFLQGTAAAEALNAAANGGQPEAPLHTASDGCLLRVARRAMACTFEFLFNVGQYPQATAAALSALDLVDRLEEQLTVYRDDSEVSRLNRLAATEECVAEEGLFELLQLAGQIHGETDGAFDVTAGPLSRAWGFTRRAGALPAAAALAAALANVGGRYLLLDPATRGVRFARQGLEINLGAIGKGYALDRCAALLSALGIENYLLHGGHSSVLGRGSHAARAPDGGWLVGVRHPLRPALRLGQICLCDRALGTSGSGTQFFEHQGRRYGHILDPRSGWPAEGTLSATVLAPTAAQADALATAFYVSGPAAARAYCGLHPEVSALLVCPGQRSGAVETHLVALDERDFVQAEAG